MTGNAEDVELRYGMSRALWHGSLGSVAAFAAAVLALLALRLPLPAWGPAAMFAALLALVTGSLALFTLYRQPEPPDLLRAGRRGIELRATAGGLPWGRYVPLAWSQVGDIRVERRIRSRCLVIEARLDDAQRAQLANRGINRATGKEEVVIARQGFSDIAAVADALSRLRDAAGRERQA